MMKSNLSLIISILIFSSSLILNCGCTKQKSKMFSPAGSGCSVIMPGVPELMTTEINTKFGTYVKYQYHSQENEITYGLSYLLVPIKVLLEYKPHEIIDSEIKSMHNYYGNFVILDKNVYYDKYPGREFTIRVKNEKIDGMMIMRLFLIDDMMYSLFMVLPQKEILSIKVKQFFDSFNIDKLNNKD